MSVAHRPLLHDIKTEVLIIGAGISGAFLAESLCRRHRVTVIDRRGIAKGSTAASTALIASEIDVPLSKLKRKIGEADAVRAWQRAALAVYEIESQTRLLGLGRIAALARRDSLYLAGNTLNAEQLEEEAQERQAAGLSAIFLDRRSLADRFGIARSAGLLSFASMAADPVRLASGYLRAAIDHGAQVFAPVEASGIETSRGSTTVATADGPVITADHVIFCTGYETPTFLRLASGQIVSTYAFATRPQPDRLWPTRCLIWEASDPYLYVRETADGRVLCGGEDEPVADAERRDALLAGKMRTLSRKLGKLVPTVDPSPEYQWAGTFAQTATGLPMIGEIPRHKGCWVVLGFGGNGTTYSRIAADLIATALAGGKDADADLFRLHQRRAP